MLALLDYTRAYDRVWRDGLLMKMRDLGVAGCVIQWIQALFRDRRPRVRWEDATSKWKVFHEGLPRIASWPHYSG